MLQSRFRFHGRGGLKYLYQQGRTVRGRTLAVRFVANMRRADSRVAVVITKKVCKSAPRRNRIRRRLYEILRKNWLHVAKGYDILVTGYEQSLLDMPHEELQSLVIELLRQAKVWYDEENTSQRN